MSISTISSSIMRTQKELADIAHKISLETKKESDCSNRIGQINRSITKNTSESTLKSKFGEIQRKQNEIAKIQVKKATLAKMEADKNGKLLKLKQDLAKEEEKERKKLALSAEKERKRLLTLEKQQQREQIAFQQKLQNEIKATAQAQNTMVDGIINKSLLTTEYDLFISHASEDKDDFVRPLAETLENLGVKVWYDEFTLKVGDSLRKSIDHGLVKSRFGTVILSSSFCSKNWTQYELDSMVAREMDGHKMILPIWHKVTKTDVINFSPALADKVALNTSISSIEEIAGQLAEVILPVEA
ncbi:toll/interleukin-1 receptor domain-containing protein [Aliivibrio fischeri]|uniref:toll/interleukin-1 receptor domain-containing protein n=1 Tax=Aliivibrio fischeri TaxID=668 RepID=UPI001F321C46|nr:toll/interleukin-1 receptor domain-containing protein [Aliivibrio fischeri]MCE7556429.1 toll/interleukin-1 receptor domain-containing protein [Aliivibrio fischeri]MCE7563006.1 toll/interleukin-1 receptor domain-containing protein [Aliivibrio fischeri]MCE7571298.1 toll/interleukin-1 receptor domain-containing protein [Aliivibrio fischeri]